jgi:tetratricopeptide (TPR) repeat protein
LRRPIEATACHYQAIELDPQDRLGWTGLGLVCRTLGRFDEAATYYSRALTIDPECGEAHRGLAICTKTSADEPLLQEMARTLSNNQLPALDRSLTGFGLGKKLDDAGRYDEAFTAFKAANVLKRNAARERGLHYEAERFEQMIDYTIAAFSDVFFSSGQTSHNMSPVPVFIVGMCRSGTSLAEQILASHPDVHGAGELLDMRRIAKRFVPDASVPSLGLNERLLIANAGEYLATLEVHDTRSLRIIDKNPDNILSLGLIYALLPSARVIICHRKPLDNILSCYFQPFNIELTFTTDLCDCTHRYIEIKRLTEHWQQTLPLQIFDLHYETLVTDLEGQARHLIEFLGLEWHPACLNFFKTDRVVNTPSMWQVRQPIYRDSIGRWKNYQRHLDPIRQILEHHGLGLDVVS